jgi:hypothetical protein
MQIYFLRWEDHLVYYETVAGTLWGAICPIIVNGGRLTA